jgi:aminoglycoside 6'-N-acetyltransferase
LSESEIQAAAPTATERKPMITLRPATPADVALLEAWDDEPVVAASDPNDDWDWENDTLKAEGLENLIAELDGRAIGFVQITDLVRDASRYWGEPQPGLMAIDIWIGEPDARGQGNGRAMMTLAIERCFADPDIHTILIDPLASNTDAIGFYLWMGFQFLEHRRFGADDCAVHRLTRAEWRAINQGA